MTTVQPIYPTFSLLAQKEDEQFSTLKLFRQDSRGQGQQTGRLFASQTPWLLPALRGILGPDDINLASRSGDLLLTEVAALRLSLLFELVDGVHSWKALINLGAAVTALSVEECYYFYAKMNGTNRRGAVRKGLRLMLAG